MNNPQDLTQDNSQQEIQANQGQEQNGNVGQESANTNPSVQQTIDWENDSNPYRKRYNDSQSQIQPLVHTLSQFAEYDHQTRSWKPRQQQPAQQQTPNVNEVLQKYDPEFVKALDGYTRQQIEQAISQFKQESSFMTEYNSRITSSRNKAIEEFGTEFEFAKDGKFNTNSPLYKLADEILQAKYAQFNPDGTFHQYTTPEAEYLATVEAYAIIAKRAKQQPVNNDKSKLGTIVGKGTKSAGIQRQLSYDEYSKLSNEQKDAYDLSQVVK